MEKIKQKQVDGVPRDTKERNILSKLEISLSSIVGKKEAGRFIKNLIKNHYFDKALMEQRKLLVNSLLELNKSEDIISKFTIGESDNIRSLAVRLSFLIWRDKIKKELAYLKKAGVLPGTWTQETAQTVLKDFVYYHGVDKILPLVSDWANDDDANVRRLLIEALRPRGVWCKHLDSLKEDPSPLHDILDKVMDDKSEYVRKAVANNLNDISKDNPKLLLKWIKKWSKGSISKEREWIITRALRSLIKDGNPDAQRLLGFSDPKNFKLLWKKSTPKELKIGDNISFNLQIENLSNKNAKARLQLLLSEPGKSNKARLRKYLLGIIELEPKEKKKHSKKIKFAHRNSVPKLTGKYVMEVTINGESIGKRTAVYKE